MTPIRPVEPDSTHPTPRVSRGGELRRAARRGRGRAGFTIIEIMTVVAIILILMGIAAIAYKTLESPVSGRATAVALQNLSAQLGEYEATAGLRNQPPNMWKKGNLVTYKPAAPQYNIWQDEEAIGAATGPQSGDVSAGGAARYSWDAIGNTQRVFQILQRVPANKDAIQRLPTKQVHGVADDDKGRPDLLYPATGPDSARRIDPPLILDAWNNPIIFVGSRGLVGVDIGKKPARDAASGSVRDYTKPADFEQPGRQVTSVGVFTFNPAAPIPAGARPFFASAGPDGNFRTGDDNVYSFNQ